MALADAAFDPGRRKPMLLQIAISLDVYELRRVSDETLATYWYIAQANPAPHGDREAGELAAKVSYEIIRRWLGKVEPPLYHHQQKDYWWSCLARLAKYVDGEWQPKAPVSVTALPEPGDPIHDLMPGSSRITRCGAGARARTALFTEDVTCPVCRELLAAQFSTESDTTTEPPGDAS